ncbi:MULTISPECIES: DUF2309 domain-containing protein [Ramlibacter]|uniref:Probable inorganic carbon transporter subunit DabA n=1 Tax=Ramlibacter aquaticus TaxID=2780094 RepID=A0ABR9SAY0_9BURK|nr:MULTISPECIES: DUF2309 domain-containing protein [Ramlibacter]MBE7939508.1 DUF2309 domain-containing protein [Ramlibacter aquaticus]
MHLHESDRVARTAAIADAVETACACIAPTWPLDQMIAVNPWWGWVDRPMAEAGAWLGTLTGTRLAIPLAQVREAWKTGGLRRDDLEAACRLAGGEDASAPARAADRLAARLQSADSGEAPTRLPLLADLAPRGPVHDAQPAREAALHQASQHCAAFFDEAQGSWHPAREQGLWVSWKQALAQDRGIHWQRGRGWLHDTLAAWPASPLEAIELGLAQLPLPPTAAPAYLSALLLDVGGWAAWCAGRRWQARLAQGEDGTLVELLAIRLAWDVLLAQDQDVLAAQAGWAAAWAGHETAVRALARRQHDDWLLQLAMDLAYQRPLARQLAGRGTGNTGAPAAAKADGTPDGALAPTAQAVFCIDVRSEVFRRALEQVAPQVHTRGFAGFFGLPIAYAPAGTEARQPQLPGLLAPALVASEDGAALGQQLLQRRREALRWRTLRDRWRTAPGSGFSFVETCGLPYAAKLLRRSLPGTAGAARVETVGLAGADASATPRLPEAFSASEAGAELAAGILRAMGLTAGFAPLVLIAGHGSQSANNPQAAGLDCGACGGQTGEVNARVLASLLNDRAVRTGLAARGIAIPDTTHFLPALHNTTTDEVQVFDQHWVPAHARDAMDGLCAQLAAAGERARAERAPALGAAAQPAAGLTRWLRQRASDWSQTRPEWGLANNASFIVAPRERTRGLPLHGRAFLHDYDWRSDSDLSVLTLIMTAPLVVTHWINMQYHASTVDNARWGSGNKLLHNVVGGRIGVFEGNGGDLRIGLARQSLHDGTRWMHTPLRLSAFIEAPTDAMDTVLRQHPEVRRLVAGGWLHLLCIPPGGGEVLRWTRAGWQPCEGDPLHERAADALAA